MTPLSRSWLTVTSLRPAWSSEVRTAAVTSADFVDAAEHPARAPATTTATTNKHALKLLMILLRYDIGRSFFRAWEGPNGSGRRTPMRLIPNDESTGACVA